jgi:hypothetical protein
MLCSSSSSSSNNNNNNNNNNSSRHKHWSAVCCAFPLFIDVWCAQVLRVFGVDQPSEEITVQVRMCACVLGVILCVRV